MKRISFVFAVLLCASSALAAGRVAQPTTNARASRTPVATTGASSGVAARSISARSATVAPTASTKTATTTKTTVQRGRSASTPTTAARAAKQSVVSGGTKVASATQNTAVDQVCWEKFSGCMDSFCMLDNASGGRCICSDKNAEYDAILEEIQKLDEQSYQLATVGVERIEMGDDADAVMAKTKAITNSVDKETKKTQSKRQSLDLSAWNSTGSIDFDEEVEDIFALGSDGVSISNKTGDALYRTSAKLCIAQLPECGTQDKLMELMYQQRIRSDCAAYENSLRASRTQSAQKLAAAQSAMREAALEQYRNANKYDLGQCTVEFKKCMQTTGGCGDDFTGCVELAARANSALKVGGQKNKQKVIKGTTSKIEITAETYDTLEAKKPLCMTVTQQCVNVRDQVWDAFLREIAPQVKSAELTVESNLRTSCISNISNCFQKACRDTMDPNDPEGSYDMCLTQPDTLRSLCKVEIDPCEAAESKIMTYVKARLSSMRVDSCTREFKECLQSEDRCGADYSQCIGLDTDTIARLCPADKLVGCQDDKHTDAANNNYVYDYLATVAQGIFLSIDNNMLTACQRAADAAMIKVCGSTENCDDIVINNGLGSRSLEYKICEYEGSNEDMTINYKQCMPNVDMITDADLGRNEIITVNDNGSAQYDTDKTGRDLSGVIDGIIYWESVKFTDNGADEGIIDVASYWHETGTDEDGTEIVIENKDKINSELASLQTSIKNAISAIEEDPKVKYCMTGRQFQGMNNDVLGVKSKTNPRFPQLTAQMRRIISTSALAQTKSNYYEKYDELSAQMLKDYSKIAERKAEVAKENYKDQRREIARRSCLYLADMSSLAVSAEPPKSAGGKIIAGVALLGAAVAVPLTGGLSEIAAAHIVMMSAAGGIAGIGLAGNAGSGSANGEQRGFTLHDDVPLTASKEVNQWNYKETITTTFDWENLVCHKCVRSTTCAETKNPLFGNKYCGTWGETVEECNDTQF